MNWREFLTKEKNFETKPINWDYQEHYKKVMSNGDIIYSQEDYAPFLYQLMQKSLKNYREMPAPGEIVNGKVSFITNNYVWIDVNSRQLLYLDKSRETDELLQSIDFGSEIKVMVSEKQNDGDAVRASVNDAMKKFTH